MKCPYEKIPAFDDPNNINVVIETPAGSRNKYKIDEEKKILTLHSVLPLGLSFPFDFGFIPQTVGGDGDPLDVMLLLTEPALVTSVVVARPIGIVRIMENKKHNDRIIAVWPKDQVYGCCKELKDLDKDVRNELARFFVIYPNEKGKKPIFDGELGAKQALEMIKEGQKKYNQKVKSKHKT